ncbi:glycosyltransferase [Planktothrix agardhii]|jgi:glycosyltransferase involved in cell wall biosynthesis|uniref:glycosyltransferase n=1 Tax=Planktothrix agardhii TaxID=1160 RepID=UPI0020A83106|nr:glycosyltransferase [Planktothrix agardhii]CAD5937884.1 putative glycosyltransferase RBE_0706 [Planktothrix agardhii]
MPLISVIIPAYNAEKTIEETIYSVLNQTFFDLELIVINDGSKDSTLEIISKFTEPRLKVFSYPNSGANYARNRGLEKASGEYISFIDADDLWTPDKLELQLKALQENPEAKVAYSWTNCIDESSKFLRQGGRVIINGDAYLHLLVANFLENGSNPLIHRDAFATVGKFDESLEAGQDHDMWLRLAKHYQYIGVPKAQILYRQSSNSMSANVWRLEKASTGVTKREFSQAPASIQYLRKRSLANTYKYLTFKALEGEPDRARALAALNFLYHVLIYDPKMFRQRVTIRTLLKILTIIFLPKQQAKNVLNKYGKIKNIGAIATFIETNIDQKICL